MKGEDMKKEKHWILVINPGSTTTKVAVFCNEKKIFEKNIVHSSLQLEKFKKIWDQYNFRKNIILSELARAKIDLNCLSAVVGRGGLLSPIPGGTYKINQKMIEDLREAKRGEHASNLGAVLAYGIAWDLEIPSFIVDPPAVDELQPLARFSGLPELERESLFHALNIKAVARMIAKRLGKKIEEVNFIVAHLGGGITVCSIKNGKIIDLNNALTEGPFTPERAGALPNFPLVELCYSGKYTIEQLKKKLVGKGGLVAYLGTNQAKQVEEMMGMGNLKAKMVYEAMAYQISKEIGVQATVLEGKVNAIIITGGIANSKALVNWIKERTKFISKKFVVLPGEHEMEALCMGTLRVLRGEEDVKLYGELKKSIGIIFWEPLSEYEIAIEEFEKVLKIAGYKFRVPDENVELIYKNCKENEENLKIYLEEFLDQNLDLIYSIGSPVIPALKRMLRGKEIPVVCAASFDPVIMGMAKSYQSSENNITGTCYRVSIKEQLSKGLLKLFPRIKKIGIIYRVGELHSEIQHDEAKEAARSLKLELVSFTAQDSSQISKSIEYFKKQKVEALFLPADSNFSLARRKEILKLSAVFPTLCALRSTVIKGGLLGLCANFTSVCIQGAKMAVKVLAGTKPSDIPIASPLAHQLIINVNTAKLAGIRISEKIKKSAELIK